MGAGAVDLVAGTVAGGAQLLVGHPFDTCKVMMQVQPGLSAAGAVRQALSQGPLGMYKGMLAPLATVAAFNAVLFSARGAAERVLSPDGAPLTVWQSTAAGAFAGVPVSLLATPTELLKCRLQAQHSKPPPGAVYSAEDVRAGRALYRGPGPLMRAIVQHEGPLALMRGLGATLLREVPGSAAYFGFYEGAKAGLAHWQGVPVAQLGSGSLMVAGGVGGFFFWAVTYPADVIKSKLQTQNPWAADRYRGIIDCGLRLYRAEGWRGLWRGYTPCAMRSVPANAVCFMTFERTKDLLAGAGAA